MSFSFFFVGCRYSRLEVGEERGKGFGSFERGRLTSFFALFFIPLDFLWNDSHRDTDHFEHSIIMLWVSGQLRFSLPSVLQRRKEKPRRVELIFFSSSPSSPPPRSLFLSSTPSFGNQDFLLTPSSTRKTTPKPKESSLTLVRFSSLPSLHRPLVFFWRHCPADPTFHVSPYTFVFPNRSHHRPLLPSVRFDDGGEGGDRHLA